MLPNIQVLDTRELKFPHENLGSWSRKALAVISRVAPVNRCMRTWVHRPAVGLTERGIPGGLGP